MLLLYPAPPNTAWARVTRNRKDFKIIDSGASPPAELLNAGPGADAMDTIVYTLLHGGEEITHPMQVLTEKVLSKIEGTIPLFPDANPMTVELVRKGMRNFPSAQHILLCQTALYLGMPGPAADYAVPIKLRSPETRRYGRFGLRHQWALEVARGRGAGERVITVSLGPNTTLTAFDGSRAVEVSSGFTVSEGVLSLTSCGDIDPTLPLHLRMSGLLLEEVSHILAKESGLAAVAERKVKFADVVEASSDEKLRLAREILLFQITKYLGAFAASLGGVDDVVFFSESPASVQPLTSELSTHILSIIPAIRIHTLNFNRWEAMAALALPALSGE